MNVNKQVVSALAPFKLPVAENLYEGTAKQYFIYNFADDVLGDAGDDLPQSYVAYIQIHYVCPLNQSYAAMKRGIRQALVSAGFTPPNVIDVSDEKDRTRHLVFECQIENDFEFEQEEVNNG